MNIIINIFLFFLTKKAQRKESSRGALFQHHDGLQLNQRSFFNSFLFLRRHATHFAFSLYFVLFFLCRCWFGFRVEPKRLPSSIYMPYIVLPTYIVLILMPTYHLVFHPSSSLFMHVPSMHTWFQFSADFYLFLVSASTSCTLHTVSC